jgi:hypothetical protein
MFSNKVRIVLIVACIGVGAINVARGTVGLSIVFFAAGALLIYAYVRGGPVWLLFRHVRGGNLRKAERLLRTIRNPELLAAGQRAYYFFTKGMIEEDKHDLDAAESSYLQALKIGLRTTNDAAVVNWRLADIYWGKGGS